MHLTKVIYRMFKSDADWIEENPDPNFHELDGEISLVDKAGKNTYITWRQNREDYEITCSFRTCFNPEPQVIKDMSEHNLWRHMIGQEIKFEHIDTGKRILKLDTGKHQLVCCAFEAKSKFYSEDVWGIDVLHISEQIPRGYSDLGAING